MVENINCISMTKGAETYLFSFRDDQLGEALRQLGRWVSDPSLSINWFDADVLAHKMRRSAAGKIVTKAMKPTSRIQERT